MNRSYAKSNFCHRHAAPCRHQEGATPEGVALVLVGNELRGDDGVAQVVRQALPAAIDGQVCSFDLGPYTTFLQECLCGHSAAIIIDAMESDLDPGEVEIIDLAQALRDSRPAKLTSSHGFSIMDELKLARQLCELPASIVLIGIRVASPDWSKEVSAKVRQSLPNIAQVVQAEIDRARRKAASHA